MEFHQFIEAMELSEPSALGKQFSWFCSDGRSMSSIDRFLLSENLVSRWKVSAQWISDRDISNHIRPELQYMVIEASSSYNIIRERPVLNALLVVVSYSHLCIKYPLPNGRVGTVKGDQALAKKMLR